MAHTTAKKRPGAAFPENLSALPRNVWILTLTSGLTDVASEMVVNILPLYLANVLGVRTPVIGLIEGIAETTASLLKVFSGWLSDRIGRRKWLTVCGYGLSTAARPFLYFAHTWGWVLAIRFADRTGKGIRTAPRDALIADSVDEHHRGLAFGLHRAGDTAGAMLGLIIVLVIVWWTQASGTALSGGTFRTITLISIIPATLAVLVLALGAHEVKPQSSAGTGGRSTVHLSLASFDRRFKWFMAAFVLFALGNSSNAFLVLRAQERGASVLAVLGMLVTFNLIYTLLSLPAGSLSDRLGRSSLVIAGWALYALVYLGFALAGAAWQIWLLFCAYGIYYGLTEGAVRALIADLVAPQQRGTAYGFFNAAAGLAALPASVLAGLLWQGIGSWPGFGPQAPFLFGAAMALAALLLLLARQRVDHRARKSPPA